jgi:hypothetical protein
MQKEGSYCTVYSMGKRKKKGDSESKGTLNNFTVILSSMRYADVHSEEYILPLVNVRIYQKCCWILGISL